MISKVREMKDNLLSVTSEFFKKYNRIVFASVLLFAFLFSASVINRSYKTYNIFDGESKRTVRTLHGDVSQVLCSMDLEPDDYEILSTVKKGKTTNVVISYTFPVSVVSGNETTVVKTSENTVSEILKLAGIKVGKDDIVEPSLDSVIKAKATVNYFNVEYVSGSYTEVIPCSLDTVYSASQEKGVNTVIQGTDGTKQVYYTTKRVNGKDVETVVNDVKVLSNAVNGKQIIGTATPKKIAVTTSEQVKSVSTLTSSVPIQLDENGTPINYKSHMTVQATGYTYTGHRCSTGVTPQPGYIAVNPRVIPYGTKMYIKTADGSFVYGYAVAADTGGFVKSRPTNIDLFFATRSAAVSFGRRSIEIYILN